MAKRKDDFLTTLEDTLVEKFKQVDLKDWGRFVIEEALYIALMSDLYLVSGRVKAFEADGTTRTPLGAERLVLWNVICSMKDISAFALPFPTGFLTMGDVKPLGWATPLLSSWEVALSMMEGVGPTGQEVWYYKALPRHMRMFMILGLPGMLRIAVRLTRQLIQIAT